MSFPRPRLRADRVADVVAGVTVAMVLVPQSLAYAELAGVAPALGLVAAVVAPLAAYFFASSPVMQSGPTAMSAVLVFGVLAAQLPPGSPEYAGAAALLALLVGVLRVTLGIVRWGALAYALSQPVLRGFTLGAAVLIVASQLPAAVGVRAEGLHLIPRAARALVDLPNWSLGAALTTVATLAVIVLLRRLNPLVPGALLAVVAGTAASALTGGALGPTLGEIPLTLPRLTLDLPWTLVPQLALGAAVIALVGFAEPTAIARRYARPGQRWDPNRELVSQGVANLAAGLAGAFPVGASFSRSALAQLAGAVTRFSGLVTGLAAMLLALATPLLADLPRAVLAAVVIAAVLDLVRLQPLTDIWRLGRTQATIAWSTAALALLLEPRIDQAVLAGVAVAVVLHLLREARLDIEYVREGSRHRVLVHGVLWFASAAQLEDAMRALWSRHRDDLPWTLDLRGVGRIDLDAAFTLADIRDVAAALGRTLIVEGLDPRTTDRLARLQARRATMRPAAGEGDSDPPPRGQGGSAPASGA
jgi:sulfate permease, SulP family